MIQGLIEEAKQEIIEGLKHLEYSLNKVKSLSNDPKNLTSEELESWEGLVARFGRVSDIFLSKYLRSRVLAVEPGFRGTFRDFLDYAEKMGLIESANFWMEIRELRNASVHEYSKKKIPLLLERVRESAPMLLKLRSIV